MGLIWVLFNGAKVDGQCKTKMGSYFWSECKAIILKLTRRIAVASALLSNVLGSTFVQAQTTPAETAADSTISLPDASDPSVSSEVLTILLTPMTVEGLSELSKAWQQIVVENVSKSAALNIALLDAADEAAVRLREQIVGLADRQAIVSANYTMVLDAWERKGGAPEAVAEHHHYLSALTVEAVRSIDPRALFRLALDWVFSVAGGLALVVKIAGVIVAIYALKIVASIARRSAARSLDKTPDISQLLKKYILIFSYWLTFFIGLMLGRTSNANIDEGTYGHKIINLERNTE